MAIAGRMVINKNCPPQLSESAVVTSGTEVNIQAALDGLTSGRTWQEKVILRGDFSVDTAIEIPSYTYLEIQGKLEQNAGGAQSAIIRNSDSSGGNTNITIKGGFLVGEKTRVAVQSGILMDNVDVLLIDNVNINGMENHGVDLIDEVTNFIVQNCVCSDNGDDGITAHGNSNGGVIFNNTCFGGTSATGASSGIEIEAEGGSTAPKNISVINNVCHDNAYGVTVVVDGSTASIEGVIVSGNQCYDNSISGILVQGDDSPATDVIDSVVSTNNCYNNGAYNIYILRTENVEVVHNRISTVQDANGRGLRANANSRCTISYNNIDNIRGNGIEATGSYYDISYNKIKNCGLDGTASNFYAIECPSALTYSDIHHNTLTDSQGTPTMSGINTFDGDELSIYYNKFNGLANNTGPGTNAIYEQSSNGPVRMWNNEHASGDTVIFVTDIKGTIDSASPITVAHGCIGGGGADAVLLATPMEAGVTDLVATLDATNITLTYGGGGTKKIAYQLSTKNT